MCTNIFTIIKLFVHIFTSYGLRNSWVTKVKKYFFNSEINFFQIFFLNFSDNAGHFRLVHHNTEQSLSQMKGGGRVLTWLVYFVKSILWHLQHFHIWSKFLNQCLNDRLCCRSTRHTNTFCRNLGKIKFIYICFNDIKIGEKFRFSLKSESLKKIKKNI